MLSVTLPQPPATVTVEWDEAPAERLYRTAAPPMRPRRVVRRWSHRGLTTTAAAAVCGLGLGVALLGYGLTHGRVRAILLGASLGVIAGILLDRVAPRLRNRTEVTLGRDELEVRQLSHDEATRLPHAEIESFEVEAVVEPLSARPAGRYQLNARLTGARIEPVFPAIAEREEAEWLRRFLTAHVLAGGGSAEG